MRSHNLQLGLETINACHVVIAAFVWSNKFTWSTLNTFDYICWLVHNNLKTGCTPVVRLTQEHVIYIDHGRNIVTLFLPTKKYY